MANVDTVIEETEMHMLEAMEAAERDFSAFRTGKASPSLVEHILVDYYGSQTRLKEIAGITTPEPRLIVVQPWDQNAIGPIEKAIQTSDIGISPLNDGRVIRLPIPELTEERRKDLTKQVHKRAEEAKVSIRNQRREANDLIKKAEKASDITEDDMRDMLDKVQELTDSYNKQIEDLATRKEEELMQV